MSIHCRGSCVTIFPIQVSKDVLVLQRLFLTKFIKTNKLRQFFPTKFARCISNLLIQVENIPAQILAFKNLMANFWEWRSIQFNLIEEKLDDGE